jgi:mono/diheme cytochrome c family protein
MRMMITIAAFAATLFFLGSEAMSEQITQKNNPQEGNAKAAVEGADIFRKNCQVCHGVGGRGDICPDLTTAKKTYGDSDADLFLTISKGRPGGMPNWESSLGADRIWKVISYIRSIEAK